MANFKETSDYFESLAQSHVDIAHDPNGKRSFFNVDLLDLIAGLKSTVARDKYIMMLVNYNSLLNQNPGKSEKELMFFILKTEKKGDINQNVIIRSECEMIAEDIIAKIQADCTALPRDQTLNKMFGGSMDSIKNVHVIHTEIIAAADRLIGVQVSLTNNFYYCPKVRPNKFV